MILAIDTNVLIKAFRQSEIEMQHLEVVCSVTKMASRNQNLKLGFDHDDTIINEYRKNLGSNKGYQKWYGRLNQLQALHYCSGKLPKKHKEKLTEYGCHEPTDHAFIGVAFNSEDKVVISEDSDFGKGPKGHESPHCCALRYLEQNMGMKILDATEANRFLWP